MDLMEASKFYGDYRMLQEEVRAELSENVEATISHEEILSCDSTPNDL